MPQSIPGVYHSKGSSPEGGVTYVLLEDNTFAITYFGGIVTGTYSQRGNNVFFKNRTEPKFVLYGRTLPTLQDTTQIKFTVRENEGVAVGMKKQAVIDLKPVFNTEANCFSYPYTYQQQIAFEDLYAGNVPFSPITSEMELDIFHFGNLKPYNDFLLINLQREYTTALDFSARYNNDTLYMDGSSNGLSKRELSTLSEEDMTFLNRYIQKGLLPQTLSPKDEFFPYSQNPTAAQQTPYIRIDATILPNRPTNLLDGSFFTASCDDE